MVSRVLGQGSGLLASVASLAVESSPSSKITHNIVVKIARLCLLRGDTIFCSKSAKFEKEKCKFWTTLILSLCFRLLASGFGL